MTNALLAVFYSVLAIMSLALWILSAWKRNLYRLGHYYRAAVSMQFIWQIILVVRYAVQDETLIRYLYDLNLPFVAFAALAWFLYVIRFYGLDGFISKAWIIALCVIPTFTMIFVLTAPMHSIIRDGLSIVSSTPLQHIVSARMPWFWCHTAYCYCLIATSFFIVAIQHFKVKKMYRRSSAMMLFVISFTLCGNLLVLANRIKLDLSLLTLSIASLLLYIITLNTHSMEFFTNVRKEIYHYIDRGIIVSDDEGKIVSINRAAHIQLKSLDLTIGTTENAEINQIDTLMKHLEEKAEDQTELEDNELGTDYRFKGEGILNLRSKYIYNNRNEKLGSLLFFENVTENRKIIDHLGRAAGIDVLTGLGNRRQFEIAMAELDTENALPLTLIVGDLNHLKNTNDKFGHAQGDIYIRLAGTLLKQFCPQNAVVARVGGDEFYIAVPQLDQSAARDLVRKVQNGFSAVKGYPFTASISMGYAVRTDIETNISDLLKKADKEMYENKRIYHTKNNNG